MIKIWRGCAYEYLLLKKEVLLKRDKEIIESLFFLGGYIVKKAKPYSSGYYSLSGIDIKNFRVPHFTEKEKHILLDLKDDKKINKWLSKFYRMSQ